MNYSNPKFKLGLLPRKFHQDTLCLHDYIAEGVLPTVPLPVDWTGKVTAPWGMDGNDEFGCCAEAMWSHFKMVTTANTGNPVVPSTDDTLALYAAVTGFDQNDPSTDNGTVMTDLLSYLQKQGEIVAWAEFDPSQMLRYQQAIYLFGGSLNGVQVRQSDQDNFNTGQIWTPGSDKVEGGHAILSSRATATTMTYVTWGAAQDATADWVLEETSEAYVAITPAWLIAATQSTPAGFNLAQLQQDLKLIKS